MTDKASAPMFRELFVFGDSLSDDGNLYTLFEDILGIGLPSEDVGYSEKFTNAEPLGDGQLWVEEIVSPLNLNPDKVHNFAFGGARAVGEATIYDAVAQRGIEFLIPEPLDETTFKELYNGPVTPILERLGPELADNFAAENDLWLTGQVSNALASTGDSIPKGSAATFLVSGNDYIFDPNFSVPDIAESIVDNAARLVDKGLDTVIYQTQPSLRLTPFSNALQKDSLDALDKAIAAQNALVIAGLQDLDAEIRIVDLAKLTEVLGEDPSAFGFFDFGDTPAGRILGSGSQPLENTVDPATGQSTIDRLPPGSFRTIDIDRNDDGRPDAFNLLDPNGAGIDEDEMLFFDVVHPSAATQDIIAQHYVASLEGRVQFLEGDNQNIRLGAQDDVVFARAGNDGVDGAQGDDVVFGGAGNDRVEGGRGKDVVVGGAGNDRVEGGRGSDVVAGSDGNDHLTGGRGDDVLAGGAGNDMAMGGQGNDLFILKPQGAPTSDEVLGGDGVDRVFIELDSEDIDIDAVTRSLDAFQPGRPFDLAIGDAEIVMDEVERILIGDSRSPEAFQEAYNEAFAGLSSDAVTIANLAAQWNVVDPVLEDFA
jgi:Ca2+-binding RTX toxin-like protein